MEALAASFAIAQVGNEVLVLLRTLPQFASPKSKDDLIGRALVSPPYAASSTVNGPNQGKQ